jgi:hypothetical protein
MALSTRAPVAAVVNYPRLPAPSKRTGRNINGPHARCADDLEDVSIPTPVLIGDARTIEASLAREGFELRVAPSEAVPFIEPAWRVRQGEAAWPHSRSAASALSRPVPAAEDMGNSSALRMATAPRTALYSRCKSAWVGFGLHWGTSRMARRVQALWQRIRSVKITAR